MRMVAMLNRLIRRPPVRTKSAFERTALLARNRSHNRTRTRPRFLFRVLVLYIALFRLWILNSYWSEQFALAPRALSKGQNPFAVIVGCSDSRVGQRSSLIRVWALSSSSAPPVKWWTL